MTGSTGGIVPYKNGSPQFANQAAWQAAMISFVQAVYPALKQAGLLVAAEVFGWNDSGGASNNDGTADAAFWSQIAPYLDALFCEYFEQNPGNLAVSYNSVDGDWTGNWGGWLNLIDVAQNAGRSFWGLNYATGDAATDARLRVYGKASFLLKWNGTRHGAYFWDPRPNDPWAADWTMDIGTPSGAMYPVGMGAFRRDYSGGTVVVNPTLGTQAIDLGGTYRAYDGTAVTSVTLGATSAAIFRN
jgi:hypothetical protein